MNADRPDSPLPPSAGPTAERIDRLVAGRLKDLTGRLSDQGGIDPKTGDELRALDCLSRLARHHLSPPPPPRRRDRLIPILMVVTSLIVGSLAFVRCGSVAAEIDVQSSTVSFETASLTRISGLTSVRLLQATVFADTQIEEPRNLQAFPLAPPLEIRPIDKLGTLTLGSLTLPAKTRVSIERATDAGTWKITLDGPEVVAAATVTGKVTLAARDVPSAAIDFGRGARDAARLARRRSAAPRVRCRAPRGRLLPGASAPGAELIREAFGIRLTFSFCRRTVNKTLSCEFTLEAIPEAREIVLLETINPTGMQVITIAYGTDLSQRRRNLVSFRLSGDRQGRRLNARVVPNARPLKGAVELEGVAAGDDRLPELQFGIGVSAANRAETLVFKNIPIRD